MEISTDKSRLDLELIYQFLTDSYWAKGRTKEATKASIENSYCFAGFVDGNQVAFGRVVSDCTVFAYIMDVFVVDEHRGKGYGQKLMKFMLEDQIFDQVKQWHLKTRDAHPFYRQFGFVPEDEPEIWMKRKKKS